MSQEQIKQVHFTKRKFCNLFNYPSSGFDGGKQILQIRKDEIWELSVLFIVTMQEERKLARTEYYCRVSCFLQESVSPSELIPNGWKPQPPRKPDINII